MEARSISVILESRKLADERRRAGKPVWDRKIDIRSIILRDQERKDNAHVVAVANEIGKRLMAGLPGCFFEPASDEFDSGLDDAINTLLQMELADFEDEEFSAVTELNGCLSEIYDWADVNRVWLGS